MEKIAAGIVMYNPDIARLKDNITAILPQVDYLVLVDNGSENIKGIKDTWGTCGTIDIVENTHNLGIAKALNQIIDKANSKGYEWVVTLDEDSIVDSDMIKILYEHSNKIPNTAIVCPKIVDDSGIPDKYDAYNIVLEDDYTKVDITITSGSLTNIKAVLDVGMFDESLFIDEVDTEMSIRLRLAGYKMVQVVSTKLYHQLGNSTVFYIFPKLGKLLNIEFFKRPKYTTNHSNLRKYYIVRNNIYVLRKYKKHKHELNLKQKKKTFLKIVFIWIFWEPFSKEKWCAIFKGFKDGLKMLIT